MIDFWLFFFSLFPFRNHPLAQECDVVETLHMRLSLLQMTLGKHIERKHVCFFAGEVRNTHHIGSENRWQKWSAWFSALMNGPKGPSLYYVSIYLDFFWPTHYVSINTVLNFSKTGHFLDPPTQSLAKVIHNTEKAKIADYGLTNDFTNTYTLSFGTWV